VNLRAVMVATAARARAAAAARRRGDRERLLAAGIGGGPRDAREYAAEKAGVVRLTGALKPLAVEGTRVNAVCRAWSTRRQVRRRFEAMSAEERGAVPALVAVDAIAGGVLDLVRAIRWRDDWSSGSRSASRTCCRRTPRARR
jgi:hypothetical protein